MVYLGGVHIGHFAIFNMNSVWRLMAWQVQKQKRNKQNQQSIMKQKQKNKCIKHPRSNKVNHKQIKIIKVNKNNSKLIKTLKINSIHKSNNSQKKQKLQPLMCHKGFHKMTSN